MSFDIVFLFYISGVYVKLYMVIFIYVDVFLMIKFHSLHLSFLL